MLPIVLSQHIMIDKDKGGSSPICLENTILKKSLHFQYWGMRISNLCNEQQLQVKSRVILLEATFPPQLF